MKDNDDFDERMKKMNSWPYALRSLGTAGTVILGSSFLYRLWDERGDEWLYLIFTIIFLAILITGIVFLRKQKNRQ